MLRRTPLLAVGLVAMLAGCGGDQGGGSSEGPGTLDDRRVIAAGNVLTHACRPEVERESVERAVATLLDAYRRAPDHRLAGIHGDGPSGGVPITVADLVQVGAVELRGCPRYPALNAQLAPALPEGVVDDPPQVPGVPEPGRGP